MNMGVARACICSLSFFSVATSGAVEVDVKHMFLCRSPLLAFDFWQSLQDMQKQGVTLTAQIPNKSAMA